ncbi:hypothetical protein [Arthrobacter sp. UNC362MFTsu5.1]|jgi:hypothetical protein|uniref:hypothetical protein n=1 Tax=Arthrobacter sp. UNC362MFTsu5.1 TaxID=1449044 RepID=UPI000A4CB703|nr:hypothetical protein [Arthrobacter sp. UNC362MFTsu5.1]
MSSTPPVPVVTDKPAPVTAAIRILLIVGILGTLLAGAGLFFLLGMLGMVSLRTAAPGLAMWSVAFLVSVADIVAALALRRGKRGVRPVIVGFQLAGLAMLGFSVVAGWASQTQPGAPGVGQMLVMLLGVLASSGLPFVFGLVAAGLLWAPSARAYFNPDTATVD